MNNIYVKEFVSFLKKNDAYKKWKKNLINNITKDYKTRPYSAIAYSLYPDLFRLKDPKRMLDRVSRFIGGAFIWDDTEEGYEFWKKLDVNWKIEVRTKFK